MVVRNYHYIIQLLILVLSLLVLVAFYTPNSKFLQIIACDVGQGDAILIQYKSVQILNDGGPDNKVLSCLSKYMPFYDRTIELVILSHPDSDHSKGLIEVFKRYKVNNFLENNLPVSTNTYKVLKDQVGSSGASEINPTNGMVIRLGLIYLDILNPTDNNQKLKTNDMGIVYLLTYGQFNALLTGDVENEVSDEISKNPKLRDIEYIKVNHHGSRNGLSQKLLDSTDPEVAVVSVGKNNRYGHPHEEILQMLKNSNAKILRTDLMGDIEVVTDGKKFWY